MADLFTAHTPAITPKTIYVVCVWYRFELTATHSRLTRAFPSIIGSPPTQLTDIDGNKHWTWTAVKDGMALEFCSKDIVKPDFRVESWYLASVESYEVIRMRIREAMMATENMVKARREEGMQARFDWGVGESRLHGCFQFEEGGRTRRVYLTYDVLRKEAEMLPGERPSGEIGVPEVVRNVLQHAM